MNSTSHNLIIECLKQLEDRHLQENLWTGKRLPEQSDFIEGVEGLFTDSALGDALHSNATGYSKETESKLWELEKQLKKVDQHGGAMKIINDPAMPRVRELAADIRSLIESEMK